jgi:acetoin utilization deacetylase AcuC-like enzyme
MNAEPDRSPTGIFYHPSFSRRSYLTQGSRLQDFPDALRDLLGEARFRMFEAPAAPEELLLKVHSPELIEEVKRDRLCSTGWHSVGGVVLGAEKIAGGEIRNGFAFIGAGGHHSGRDFFGGYCCFNDVVIAITVLRERYGLRRFAILDTDAHHGDGTRSLLLDDPDVLHVCVCHMNHQSKDGTKVDVAAPGRPWWFAGGSAHDDADEAYFRAAADAFVPRVETFRPDFMFWYFGFDTHRGDYGDIGLSIEAYRRLAVMMRDAADRWCGGRLEVVLGGGSRSDIARSVIPPIIALLGTEDQ